MQYHPEDFLVLSTAIVDEGGEALPETCEPKAFSIKLPNARGKLVKRTKYTTGCLNAAKFKIPYDAGLHIRLYDDDELEPAVIIDHKGEDFEGEPVVACAVDDAIGLWPRYKDFISNRSYQR